MEHHQVPEKRTATIDPGELLRALHSYAERDCPEGWTVDRVYLKVEHIEVDGTPVSVTADVVFKRLS